MVELKGSLGAIGLLPLVQLIGDLQHTGTLQLRRSPAEHAQLAFDDGRLVAAALGEHHGLQALAECVLEMGDAEFEFVEGPSSLERTLDLGAADLNKLLGRINSGEFASNGNAETTEVRSDAVCPLLGFADDRARHYSRPTALHRCYAGGAASLVSTQEQRELCLAGRQAACPRYRNASAPALPARDPEVTVFGTHTPDPSPTGGRPPMPPGVAARLAAAGSQLHSSESADIPSWIGHSGPRPHPTEAEHPIHMEATPQRSRGLPLVLLGGLIGLILVGLFAFFVLPVLQASLRQSPPTTAALEPLPTATSVPVPVVARANAAPISAPPTAPAPTAAPRVPTPTTVIPVGRSLMDVRFAAGSPDDWLDNPPYASWSDGAYRFEARDTTHFVAAGVPLDQVLADVVLSATFRKTGGPPGGGYGLIVRDAGPEPRDGQNQQMNAYVLETGDLGEYGIWRRDGDHWVDLVPWTHSPAVRSGGSPNELMVRALGDTFTFVVNGQTLASVQDGALQAGGVGMFVGGDYNEVALDHFSVQLPANE